MSHSKAQCGVTLLTEVVLLKLSLLAPKAQDMNILFEAIHIDDKVCEPVSTYDKADRVLGNHNDKGIVNRTFFCSY